MSTEKKYKVISFAPVTPPSNSERACTTTNSITAKTSTKPGDYGFVTPDKSINLSLFLLRGKTEVRCKSYTPASDPRNYCYNKGGGYRTFNIQDTSVWKPGGTESASTQNINLTPKYTVPGLKVKNKYLFEDCGIPPEDSQIDIEYFEADCLGKDVMVGSYVKSSPCDEHVSKCCNITTKKHYKYARATPTITYELQFGFLVKISSSYVWNCFAGSSNPLCVKTYDNLSMTDIEDLKRGPTKKMRRFLGNVSHVHWYMDIEIIRTNYKKLRPTERRPKVNITGLETVGYSELPTTICPSCQADYLFSISSPGSFNPTQKASDIVNDQREWRRVSSFPDSTLDEGPNAGKTLTSVSSGNDTLLNNFKSFLDPKTAEWRNIVRTTPRESTPSLPTENKEFTLPKSLAYLKLNFKMKAALNPKRTDSCFGCSNDWTFLGEGTESYFGGPTP